MEFDFYPIVKRAITASGNKSADERRAIYVYARHALIDKLRCALPKVSASDIDRAKLMLEEAIRRCEVEVLGQGHEKTEGAKTTVEAQSQRAEINATVNFRNANREASPLNDTVGRDRSPVTKELEKQQPSGEAGARELSSVNVSGAGTASLVPRILAVGGKIRASAISFTGTVIRLFASARARPRTASVVQEALERAPDKSSGGARINLAWRDVESSLQRFILTVMGVGAIIIATMGINGLYRGIVYEALLVVKDIGADLWVVQGGRTGPFAELSQVPDSLVRRLEGIAEVREARRFIYFNKQFDIAGHRQHIGIIGLDFPRDAGHWVPIIDGRHLETSHYEAIADRSLGFIVGDVLRLGRDDYTVVGVVSGQVDIGGDGLLFVSVQDAQAIDVFSPSEAILLNRAARRADSPIPGARIAAVMLELDPSADVTAVRNFIQSWGDVNVLSRAEQEDILLNGRLWKLRIQILAFVATMFVVAGVVISLTIYTMTLEKLHSIAILKLIGAKDRVIIGMILQISLLIGAFAFVFAIIIANILYPHFPRRILLLPDDMVQYFFIMQAVCALASIVGILRAKAVRAQEVLA